MIRESMADIQRIRGSRRFWTGASVLTLILATLIARSTAANQTRPVASRIGPITGTVVSSSGARVIGGAATHPGHPVVGATVHLGPIAAIDVSTRMTASAIYTPPYSAE